MENYCKMKRNKMTGYLCIVGGAISTFVNSGIFRSTTLIYEMLLEKFGASKAVTGWVFGTFELVGWAVGRKYHNMGLKKKPAKAIPMIF